MPFGVCNAPWLFQHMSVTFSHLGPESGILTYMDDIICLNCTFEAHLKSLEQRFSAFCQIKKTPFKKAFGPAQREAFAGAKRALTSAPVLKYPDFTREFIVHTDASEA